MYKKAQLILEDGSIYEGYSFGSELNTSGEVVFNTGMTGYPEAITDPSYHKQILVFTYPLMGNYGIPENKSDFFPDPGFESNRIQVEGVIINNYSEKHSHWNSFESLGKWLIKNNIPGLFSIDTRKLTMHLREVGTMSGKIIVDNTQDVDFCSYSDLDLLNNVVSNKPETFGTGKHNILMLDGGCKRSIIHNIVERNSTVTLAPWNSDVDYNQYDGFVISSGPGNPELYTDFINRVKKILELKKPILGICLGHQLSALASGAKTYKLKYGHRGQNQPVMDLRTKLCYMTSQNHGFAVDTESLPWDWEPLFVNLNDGTNEGIRHKSYPYTCVQFHPEASPGPADTTFLFDEFIEAINK